MEDAVRQMLIDGREHVRQGWCQENLAKNRAGYPVAVWSEEAVEFCAVGALHAVRARAQAEGQVVSMAFELYDQAARALSKATGAGKILALWNDDDDRTQADVLQAYDKAIGGGDA